jgi:hypothetical protein
MLLKLTHNQTKTRFDFQNQNFKFSSNSQISSDSIQNLWNQNFQNWEFLILKFQNQNYLGSSWK